jgi:hypothetical protein
VQRPLAELHLLFFLPEAVRRIEPLRLKPALGLRAVFLAQLPSQIIHVVEKLLLFGFAQGAPRSTVQ